MKAKCHPKRDNYAKLMCTSCYHKQWRKDNPEKELAKRRRAHKKRKAAGYYDTKKYKDRTAALKLKYRYGITGDYYAQLHDRQHGLCMICKKRPGEGRRLDRKLVVDHDHRTGEVRALLCHACNIGLGWVENNTNILYEVKRYLEHYNSRL